MKEESQVAAQKQKFKLVTDKKFYKRVLSIMLPVALQQAINMGVNMRSADLGIQSGKPVLQFLYHLLHGHHRRQQRACRAVLGCP